MRDTAAAGKGTTSLQGVLTVSHSYMTLLQACSKPVTRGRETEGDAEDLASVTAGSWSSPFHSMAYLLP